VAELVRWEPDDDESPSAHCGALILSSPDARIAVVRARRIVATVVHDLA